MKGAFRIGTFSGIPVDIHWTFGLMGFYIWYLAQNYHLSINSTIWLFAIFIALFVCVVLHEFGHALTARRFGVKTQDIILSPIGGVARLERLPERPIEEFYVAAAGPLVNVAIVLLLLPYFFFFSWSEFLDHLDPYQIDGPIHLVAAMLIGNIVLAGFNLLPAFPMDGGRILRSLLSIRWGRLRATQIASYLGNFFGILMVVYGAYTWSITTIFIGVFVFLMAYQEYKMVKLDELLGQTLVSEILRKQFTPILPDQTMEQAINTMKTGLEKNFLVMNEEQQLLGVMHEAFLIEAAKKKDLDAPAMEYTSQNYELIGSDLSLRTIFQKMQQKGYSILPVLEEGVLVGVIDVSMVNHFLRFQKKQAS